MSLTIGNAPFSPRSTGVFNFELPERRGLIYFEDSPRRVRGIFGGETVVESRRVKMLHESGHLPVYYFPRDDVNLELLEPSDHSTRCPFKGEASYWSVRVGERLSENAAWGYPEPIAGAPWLGGYLAFYWHALDEWFEEEERAHVHPRDPYHRVDVLDSSRHVRVSLRGELLAETRRPRVLFETGLPPRHYFPREDVRADVLREHDKHTGCAYKGEASYYSVLAGGEVEEAVVWTYPEPTREAEPVAGYLAFFDERVDVEVDGQPLERPETPWSPRARPAHATA